MQVKKQQLELDMEQQTGFQIGQEGDIFGRYSVHQKDKKDSLNLWMLVPKMFCNHFKLSSSGKSRMGIILILTYQRNEYVRILTPRKPESSRMLTHGPKVTEIQCESNLPSKASFSFRFPLSPPSFG